MSYHGLRPTYLWLRKPMNAWENSNYYVEKIRINSWRSQFVIQLKDNVGNKSTKPQVRVDLRCRTADASDWWHLSPLTARHDPDSTSDDFEGTSPVGNEAETIRSNGAVWCSRSGPQLPRRKVMGTSIWDWGHRQNDELFLSVRWDFTVIRYWVHGWFLQSLQTLSVCRKPCFVLAVQFL